jgi:uncharacterized surface protein with fasciclin (FAS1) repeats
VNALPGKPRPLSALHPKPGLRRIPKVLQWELIRETSMFNSVRNCLVSVALTASMMDAGVVAQAQDMSGERTVMVGGAAMYPSRTIVQNAMNSRDHTILVQAVQAAGLVDTLSGSGPFTVFAPTNMAFQALPAELVQSLMQPENRAMLQTVLTYHVVAGRMTAADLMRAIRAGGGSARLTTVQGGVLTARMQGNMIVLTDARGGMATVTQADVMQSNGVIHVTNAVSMPAN